MLVSCQLDTSDVSRAEMLICTTQVTASVYQSLHCTAVGPLLAVLEVSTYFRDIVPAGAGNPEMLLLCRLAWIFVGIILGYHLCDWNGPVPAAAQLLPSDAGKGTGDCAGVPAVECSVRLSKCAPVTSLVRGAGGPVGGIFTCATQLSIPKTQIIPAIGPAFSSGHPESIVDRVSNDTAVVMKLRRCLLMSAGLLGLNDTINREALAGKAQAQLSWNPPLATTVAAAVRSCPEPPDLKYMELLACVKQRCVNAVSVAAFAFQSPEQAKASKKCSKKKGCKKH